MRRKISSTLVPESAAASSGLSIKTSAWHRSHHTTVCTLHLWITVLFSVSMVMRVLFLFVMPSATIVFKDGRRVFRDSRKSPKFNSKSFQKIPKLNSQEMNRRFQRG